MKTPEEIERITRWLDGAMTDTEKAAFQESMRTDAGLRLEVSAMESLSGQVRTHATLEKAVPHPDFFNSQIQERISELQRADERRHSTRSPAAASWLGWLRAPWAMAGTAALLAVGLFLALRVEKPQTQVVSFYVPDPDVKASVNYNVAAEATVITLDGLHAIPDDRPISGLKVHHSDSDPEMASTTLFDAEGKVLLVMATDSRSRPVLLGGAAQ